MSRILSLAISAIALISPLYAQVSPLKDVPWADPGHARYFKYQDYLVKAKLDGQTKDTWAKLKAEERVKRSEEGELFLRKKLEELLGKPYLNAEESALIKAVWGEAAEQGVQRVATARKIGDPAQVELALKSVKPMLGKAAEKIDWNDLFDGAKVGAEPPADPLKKDYLAPEKKAGFLESLGSDQTQKALSTRKAFSDYLRQHNVPPVAMPGLLAMYDVHTKAGPAEKKELSHILPTVVRFLDDGKPIVVEDKIPGAYGYAIPGEYDSAEKVAVTPMCADADPVVVADVLTHEFQHVYDMYTGRYYSLDSEMRGFKTNVMFYRAMKTAAPAKLEQMKTSNDDINRAYVKEWGELENKLNAGQRDFADQIAFGHGYNHYEQGTFQGRLPLREAVDPKLGAERELQAKIRMRDEAQNQVRLAEVKQSELLARVAKTPSRELDRQLEQASKDLQNARAYHAMYEKDVTIRTLRLSRMRSEAAWLDKKGAGQKDPDPYDLHLQVDEGYVTQ